MVEHFPEMTLNKYSSNVIEKSLESFRGVVGPRYLKQVQIHKIEEQFISKPENFYIVQKIA